MNDTNQGIGSVYETEDEKHIARLEASLKQARERYRLLWVASNVLVNHAKEVYPHFESERGQKDIAAVEAILGQRVTP